MDKNIQKYMAFVKTVQCGSFSNAAELLHYSQSGISRMIGDLEKEWGVVLLERNKYGVHLTCEGEKLLPYAKELCGGYEKLLMEVNDLNGLKSGTIRIATISSVATHWLPNIIREFQKDYPGIDYELFMGDYGEIEEWIMEGHVDFGFMQLPTKKEFETLELSDDELMVVLPENHPLADCDKFPIEALAEDPLMLFDKNAKDETTALLEAYNLKPRVYFTVWDDYVIMSMVEKGLGISILPKLILRRNPYHIAVKSLETPIYRKIGLAMKNRKSISLAARRFLDYLEYRDN